MLAWGLVLRDHAELYKTFQLHILFTRVGLLNLGTMEVDTTDTNQDPGQESRLVGRGTTHRSI